MKIGIACDHHGVDQKNKISKFLTKKGYSVCDFGPNDTKSVDYPTYAFSVSEAVRDGNVDCGILMCGTGIGMSIAANKVKGIRCARICSCKDAKLAKEHNHANIIAFSANIPFYKMKKMIVTYINTEFSNEERHIRRVNMINDYND